MTRPVEKQALVPRPFEQRANCFYYTLSRTRTESLPPQQKPDIKGSCNCDVKEQPTHDDAHGINNKLVHKTENTNSHQRNLILKYSTLVVLLLNTILFAVLLYNLQKTSYLSDLRAEWKLCQKMGYYHGEEVGNGDWLDCTDAVVKGREWREWAWRVVVPVQAVMVVGFWLWIVVENRAGRERYRGMDIDQEESQEKC